MQHFAAPPVSSFHAIYGPMKPLITLILCLFVTLQTLATTPSLDIFNSFKSIQGQNIKIAPNKGLVVVFLSATCPCSDSHMSELKSLASDFPEFTFLGVHSNIDEPISKVTEYFASAKMPFEIVKDENTKIADHFKALKTPHAFVFQKNGDVAYQGGVSSSRHFDKADQKFLREALTDLNSGKKVRTPEGRTLGCAISRGEKNVW